MFGISTGTNQKSFPLIISLISYSEEESAVLDLAFCENIMFLKA